MLLTTTLKFSWNMVNVCLLMLVKGKSVSMAGTDQEPNFQKIGLPKRINIEEQLQNQIGYHLLI